MYGLLAALSMKLAKVFLPLIIKEMLIMEYFLMRFPMLVRVISHAPRKKSSSEICSLNAWQETHKSD